MYFNPMYNKILLIFISGLSNVNPDSTNTFGSIFLIQISYKNISDITFSKISISDLDIYDTSTTNVKIFFKIIFNTSSRKTSTLIRILNIFIIN